MKVRTSVTDPLYINEVPVSHANGFSGHKIGLYRLWDVREQLCL